MGDEPADNGVVVKVEGAWTDDGKLLVSATTSVGAVVGVAVIDPVGPKGDTDE